MYQITAVILISQNEELHMELSASKEQVSKLDTQVQQVNTLSSILFIIFSFMNMDCFVIKAQTDNNIIKLKQNIFFHSSSWNAQLMQEGDEVNICVALHKHLIFIVW